MKKIKICLIFIAVNIYTYSQTVYFDDITKLYGIIDRLGKIILKPTYKWMSSIENGTSVFELNKKYGLINEKGIIVLKPIFNERCNLSLGEINENMIRVVERKYLDNDSTSWEEKIGFYNTNGVLKIPYKYDWSSEFCNGIACVWVNDNYNFINTLGEYLSDKGYLKFIKLNGTYYGIDEKSEGELIFYKININKKNELAQNQSSLKKSLEEAKFEEKCNYNLNILHNYKDVLNMGEEKRIATNLWGYKNEKDEVIISPKYQYATQFKDNRALVFITDSKGIDIAYLINEKGNIVCNLSEKIQKLNISECLNTKFENGILQLYTHESIWEGKEQTHIFKFYLVDINGNIIKQMSEGADSKYCRNNGG